MPMWASAVIAVGVGLIVVLLLTIVALWRNNRSQQPLSASAPAPTATPVASRGHRTVERKKHFVRRAFGWCVRIAIFAVPFAIWWFGLGGRFDGFVEWNGEWNWTKLWFFLSILYVIGSCRIVGPDETAAVILLGLPTNNASAGLQFVPFGIMWLERFSRLVEQLEIPGEPQKIWRLVDEKGTDLPIPEDKLEEGFKPPFRITFAQSPSVGSINTLNEEVGRLGLKSGVTFNPDISNGDREDGLHTRRITAEVVLIIRYRINDAMTFVSVIGDRDGANRQIEDLAVALISRVFTKISVAQALHNLTWASHLLTEELKKRVGADYGEQESWGLDLETAQVKLVGFNHSLNKAITAAGEATYKKKATITDAEATSEKLRLEGEGTGAAEKAVLVARTRGLQEMSTSLGVSGSLVLGTEAARAITANPGQKTIIAGAGGFSELIGAAAAIGEAVKSHQTGAVTPPPPPPADTIAGGNGT